MTGDRLEETLKHYLVQIFPDLATLKKSDGEYLHPELVYWTHKTLLATNFPNINIKQTSIDQLKNKDVLYAIETINKIDGIEKDVVFYKLIRNNKNQIIKKEPTLSLECKLCKYLKHVQTKQNKENAQFTLFTKILKQDPKFKNVDFSKYLAYFLTPESQEESNDYYVFCFDEIERAKNIKNDRQTNPTKLSFLSKQEMTSLSNQKLNKIIPCPEINLEVIQNFYKTYKGELTPKEKEILEYFKNKTKLSSEDRSKFWYISDQPNRMVYLVEQAITHKLANGIYKNPLTNAFDKDSKIITNHPLANKIYSIHFKPFVKEYVQSNYQRLEKEDNLLQSQFLEQRSNQKTQLKQELQSFTKKVKNR